MGSICKAGLELHVHHSDCCGLWSVVLLSMELKWKNCIEPWPEIAAEANFLNLRQW
jgi:hypothetical protein